MVENGPKEEIEAVLGTPQLVDTLSQWTLPRAVTRGNTYGILAATGGDHCEASIHFNSGDIEIFGSTGDNHSQMFFGFNRATDLPVAVRTIHPDRLGNCDFHQRLEREVRFLTQRNNDDPHYWPYLHETKVISHPYSPNFKVMSELVDLIPGVPLEKLIVLCPEITSHPSFVLAVAIQLVHAVEQYEEAGWVNRDLKPGNIMILRPTQNDVLVKLFDAGMLHEPNSLITHPGRVAGTPSHMSPEQVQGLVLDCRSDLYAIGVIMYELLNRHRPFFSENPIEMMAEHVREPVRPMQTGVPELIKYIVLGFLAKNRHDRVASASEARKILVSSYRALYPDDALAPYFSPALAC